MHEGHRERLKEKLITSPNSLQPHEVLEILLFYAIPRKNTNEIAHQLLNMFDGSLKKVFSADMEILKSIKGVGENTAHFLKTMSKILDLISVDEPIVEKKKITCPMDTLQIVKPLFENATKELFVLLYFSQSKSILTKVRRTFVFSLSEYSHVNGFNLAIPRLRPSEKNERHIFKTEYLKLITIL